MIRKRRLGRTERMVSEIGLGGAHFRGRDGKQPHEDGVRLIRHALSLGVDYIDSAECYIDSEEILGKALEGYEGECFLATKFGHRPPDFDFTRAAVLESVEESRRLLRGRGIDLLQLHTPGVPAWERIFGPNGALEGMREARERGWCRWLGITGHDVEFVRRCIETDAFDTALIFLCYDLLDQSGESLLAEAKAHDMAVIIGSPLRMGLFGGARNEVLRLAGPDTRRLERLEALFANEPGRITAAAIRFLLASPDISVVLSGSAASEEIESVLAAAQEPMRPELLQAVRTSENTPI